MKNIILAIALTLTGVVTYAQVGVGTQEPQTTLHVVGKNTTSIAVGGSNTPGALDATDGITVPVVTTNMTAAPPAGTKVSQLVYSTHASSTGYYYWNGTTWTALGAATTTLPTFRTVAGAATTNILTSDFGNVVVITGGVSGDIQLPSPAGRAGQKITIVSTGLGSQSLTNLNPTYLTVTYGSIQQYGAELITDGTNWYALGGQ